MNRLISLYPKKLILGLVVFSLVFASFPAKAQVVYSHGGDLNSFVCDILGSIGLGCGVSKNSSYQSKQQNSNLQASVYNVTVRRTSSDDEVILVKVPAVNGIKPTLGLNTNEAIFEIIRGQKHFIPAMDIFFDYGFDLSAVQSITHKDLKSFPRAKLVNVFGDKKSDYYITEGHMIRLIPNENIFESYGDRREDVITISKKEFNFYPRNQYVFIENPLSNHVFQISGDGVKRYVVPQVVKRLRITQEQVAPINNAQFNAYSYGQPIMF